MDWERLTGTHSVSPVSEVSPYTHRDAVTHLEEIKNLNRWVRSEVARIESLARSGDEALSHSLTQFQNEMSNKLKDMDFKFTEMFKDAKNEGLAFDPTDGTTTHGVSTVISHVFDNARIFALFAHDFDKMNLTAKEWDLWMDKNSARHFDLGYTYPNLNDVMG